MIKKILLIILGGLVCFGVAMALLTVDCEQHKHPPNVPIYPGSVLTEMVSNGIGKSRPIVTANYVTTDPPENLIAFYQVRGECGLGNDLKAKGREVCHGDAIPFGEYFVYIDLTSYIPKGSTFYSLEIRWHGCSDGLE